MDRDKDPIQAQVEASEAGRFEVVATFVGVLVAILGLSRLGHKPVSRGRFAKPKRSETQAQPEHEPVVREESDINVKRVVLAGLALVGLTAVALVITSMQQFAFVQRVPDLNPHPPGFMDAQVTPPPAPQLQAAPVQDMEQIRAAEDKALHSYGWVDQKSGIVHIPIERAMDLILQLGLPARPADQSNPFRDQGQELPSGSSSGRTMEKVTP